MVFITKKGIRTNIEATNGKSTVSVPLRLLFHKSGLQIVGKQPAVLVRIVLFTQHWTWGVVRYPILKLLIVKLWRNEKR